MGAREGAGNFVTGFLSAFDPNAFTRSYQRAQDRAERAKTRTEDVTHRDRVYKLQESDYNLRKKRQEAELERLKKKDEQDALKRAEDRGLDQYEKMLSGFQGKGMHDTWAYISKNPDIRKAYRTGDKAEIAKFAPLIREQLGHDTKRQQKEAVERSRAAQALANKNLSYLQKAGLIEKSTKPNLSTIGISRSFKEGRKALPINEQWIMDMAHQDFRTFALNEIQAGRDVNYYEWMKQPKNSSIGAVLERRKGGIPDRSLIPFLFTSADGSPMRSTRLIDSIKDGSIQANRPRYSKEAMSDQGAAEFAQRYLMSLMSQYQPRQ